MMPEKTTTHGRPMEPPGPEDLLKMIQQLLTDPQVMKALIYEGCSESTVREFTTRLLADAKGLLERKKPSAEVAWAVLHSLTNKFMDAEMYREIERRGWTLLQTSRSEGQAGTDFSIQELGGEKAFSTSGVVWDTLFPSSSPPLTRSKLAKLDYGLFVPQQFLATAREALKRGIALTRILGD
jgi:hypothetical protein